MQSPDVSPNVMAEDVSARSSPANLTNAGEATVSEESSKQGTESRGETLALAEAGLPQQGPMSRVIDVPLTVTLRFGQRQLTVRELLELNTGSLVELDQQVEEPVHLMLGDRVIARGEVVIVDGNYGMRVLEVVEHPATQRIAALGRA